MVPVRPVKFVGCKEGQCRFDDITGSEVLPCGIDSRSNREITYADGDKSGFRDKSGYANAIVVTNNQAGDGRSVVNFCAVRTFLRRRCSARKSELTQVFVIVIPTELNLGNLDIATFCARDIRRESIVRVRT